MTHTHASARILSHPVRIFLGGALHQNEPQAPDVGAVAVLVVPHPLRRHVLEGSYERSAHGEAALKPGRDSEVGHLTCTVQKKWFLGGFACVHVVFSRISLSSMVVWILDYASRWR